MKRMLIYHVIGTLEWHHITRSLQSLRRQDIHWETLVLYNGGQFPDEKILLAMSTAGVIEMFDEVNIYPYDVATPKSASADWYVQMQNIGGADRYLVHKADFYLADGVCKAFEMLPGGTWFVPFNKFDMKSRAELEDFERYAQCSWIEALHQPDRGTYERHLGKLAIPFYQRPNVDGTMHGYTDSVRAHYAPSAKERQTRWGVAWSIRELQKQVPFIWDDRFFALHMWHETPDRDDWNKNTSPSERF